MANIPNSLIAKAHAERLRTLSQNNGEDYYNAARDAALSEVLSIAIKDIFE